MIRRQVIGAGLVLGIVSGILIDTYMRAYPAHIIYVAEAKEEVIQIEVEIDWSTERVEQEIRKVFHETPNTAVAVGRSESGTTLKPDAYNPEWHYDSKGNKICQGSYGVMQIACVHHIEDPEALFDVELNLSVGRKIYEKSGWKPWGGYTSGGWETHL